MTPPRHKIANEMALLIAACQPGRHFIGLWVVRQKEHRIRRVYWTVTFWDRTNEYGETPFYRDPLNALRSCAKALKVKL